MQAGTLSKKSTQHLFTLIALCIEEAEDNDLRNTAKKLLEVVTVFQTETNETDLHPKTTSQNHDSCV